jgi:hypothetical protein
VCEAAMVAFKRRTSSMHLTHIGALSVVPHTAGLGNIPGPPTSSDKRPCNTDVLTYSTNTATPRPDSSRVRSSSFSLPSVCCSAAPSSARRLWLSMP